MTDMFTHFVGMTSVQKLGCIIGGAIAVYIIMIAIEFLRGTRSGWTSYTGLYDTQVSTDGALKPGAQDTIRVSPI